MDAQAILHFDEGNALVRQGRLEEALASYDRAIALAPDYAQAHNNRGNLLQLRLELPAAIASYDRAIALDPAFADVHWNKANVLLLGGDFAQGFPLYEWRWKRPGFTSPQRGFVQPLWLGEQPLAGRTILLHAEQGLGDTVQFCRYVPLVAALGARVVLEVPAPLLRLMHSLAGVSEWVEKGAALPPFDCHCPLLSLPLAFKTRADSIPQADRYLASDPARRAYWADRLGPRSRPLVGVVWSGRAAHAQDRQRSIGLATLLQWLPDVFDYVSLQQEVRGSDLAALQASKQVTHFGAELVDFSDTAALCDCVDVVISVDTSVAHVAAALGKPTWILLPHNPDWRWQLERRDCPWYPSVSLYRQERAGDWDSVLKRVASDLTGRWLGGRPCPVCRGACSVLGAVDFHKSCEEVRGTTFEPSGISVHYCLCPHCGFCFAPEIAAWTPEQFAQRIYNDDYVLVDPDSVDKRPTANAASLVALFGDQGTRLRHLDYGGGAGQLSRLLREARWQSVSYDPVQNLHPAQELAGPFDLVTAFEVFEHVADPQVLMATLRSMLAPDGIVLLSTLLSDGHIQAGQPPDWWYAAPRNGHISLFSLRSLGLLAQQHGFALHSFSNGLHVLSTTVPPWAAQLFRQG